jgi:hypothetical protein
MKDLSFGLDFNSDETFEVDSLLHPAQAFENPTDVVNDPDLTPNEKRAILASWASDACAIEAAPNLRSVPKGRVVRFDEIMDDAARYVAIQCCVRVVAMIGAEVRGYNEHKRG